jgi:hypothetical protein
MRFILLRTECNSDGTISFFGASQYVRRASGNSINWIDLREAKTNTIDPDSCDLLSFDDNESAVALLDDAEMSGVDNICIVGVEAE